MTSRTRETKIEEDEADDDEEWTHGEFELLLDPDHRCTCSGGFPGVSGDGSATCDRPRQSAHGSGEEGGLDAPLQRHHPRRVAQLQGERCQWDAVESRRRIPLCGA